MLKPRLLKNQHDEPVRSEVAQEMLVSTKDVPSSSSAPLLKENTLTHK
jgi:hypothetical protein